jgi:hypothetical protein
VEKWGPCWWRTPWEGVFSDYRPEGAQLGNPRTRLSAAQTSNVSRQPNKPLSKVVNGQLTVDAKTRDQRRNSRANTIRTTGG